MVSVLCCLRLLILSGLFWFYSFGWFYCWCHMMLSSRAVLVSMSFVLSSDILLFIFIVYCFWCSFVILFFRVCSRIGGLEGGVSSYFMFCFLLLSFPISLSLFYKLVIVFGVFRCWFPVLFCWVVYSISEQVYLVKFVVSYDLPKSIFGLIFE